jgi:hypothetical protein
MRFVLLRMIVATNASISCLFVTRHLFPADEETGIGSLDVAYSLEEASEFVGEALLPNLTVGVGLDEMAIFEDVTCDVIDDGADEIEGIGSGCSIGWLDDTVRVFKEGTCGGDVSMRWKRGGRYEVNHGH